MTARVVVLASGDGSNFQAIVDAVHGGTLAAQVVALVSDKPDAFALQRARGAGVEAIALPRMTGEDRASYDGRLAEIVAAHAPDIVVLAGWMRVLTMKFLGRFPSRVINLHPALPGEFPGTDAIGRALQAAQRLGLRRTGVMVHFVPDEGVDDGPVIATAEVPITGDDTLESLAERVHTAEHALLVDALRSVIAGSAAERG
jgi:phosphoribosylglycinamide formyltransferase 1